ncbi:acyl-CoA dehydrogenase family protein [Kitasatospora sp. NPDC059673]|uniref:acyl-CoA dehydrogenase family protein n=1 Tax=Kitasatospora sp. NPDC059673 TaxID=3346901 RepID=UPI0036A5F4C2
MTSADTARLLERLRAREDGMDGDVREVYRHLGRAGVLAPSWPEEHGGRGGDFTETMVLLEELVRHGVPQSLYYISVQIVGSLIMQSGSEEQKRELLPRLASGELAACILFTEPEHGSDLASVTARAEPDQGGGWVLDGRKTYNLKTGYADLALCVVRTDDELNRYEGLTLFLVPLDAPGVTVRPMAALAGEQFHDVTLDQVRVGPEALLGAPGAGWSLITRMFAAERSGLDYYARARHWLDLTAERLTDAGREPDSTELADLARHRARLDAGRLLTCRAMQQLQEDRPDIARASMSKWHCSETAQAISWWSLEVIGVPLLDPGRDEGVLEAAYREAPGMTISGGASEVLLDIVTGARLLEDVETGGN